MRFKAVVKSLANMVAVPLVTLGCSLYTIFVVAPTGSRERGDWIIHRWAELVCKLAGVRLNVTGKENLKHLRSMIIVSNHLSHFDIPVLYLALPMSFRMVAKIELFKIPFFGRAMRALNFVPVERQSSEGAKSAVAAMKRRFDRGETIWIAAEGTRFNGEGVGTFKSGAFHMAMQTGTPVVPVSIFGTQKVLPKGGFLISWREPSPEVCVHIGAPVSPEEFENRKDLRDRVRETIVSDFGRLKSASDGHHHGLQI
jgi:1-acyl-sn-glycerol-3-phosphate acyltransferase